jgi:2-C-methyl-D-erythritol 4-phosphate cytidylyltransferase
MGQAWAIVLAAGGGTRFGGPKQFADLGGRPLVAHPVRAAGAACDGVVVVLPATHREQWPSPDGWADIPVTVVAGGPSRASSVRAGLAAVPADVAVIVVTDAAHPLASAALYRSVVQTVRAGADAAVPGLPLTEVVKAVEPGRYGGRGGRPAGYGLVAGASLPRETHKLVQTPHAFRADLLRDAHAHAHAHADAVEAVEDSAMVAGRGGTVVVVPGESMNIHVTTPEELEMARRLLAGCAPAAKKEGLDELGDGRVRAVR